jgi:hypothetical protein
LAGLMSTSDVANWASIASLVISIFNVALIVSLKRRIVANVTLEPLLERLREGSTQMNGYLLLFEAAADDFDATAAICEADVRAVQKRLGVRQGWFCRDLLKSLRVYRNHRSYDAARRVYNHLQKVIREVANRLEERRIAAL